jgi:hypothetical protein
MTEIGMIAQREFESLCKGESAVEIEILLNDILLDSPG